MKIWGYWATLGWTVLAFLAGQLIAFALLVWSRGELNSLVATPFDGRMISIFILAANPIAIAVIALAVRLARADQVQYLALKWPQWRYVAFGVVSILVLIAAFDAALYFSGRDLVTPFQLQSYSTAATAGWLPVMLIGAIVVAPAGEEIMFRGFLFRGWARSQRSVWPAIVVISLLWAGLHVQYDWTGILQIFIVGLFLGFMRHCSGSTLLTFLLHALFNLEGTMETVLQMHAFS